MDTPDLLNDDQAVGEMQGGASSTEDFWMFFSFAMILIVFVLMNYVNYLNSLVVKAPSKQTTPTQQETPAEAPPPTEIHVVVEPAPDGATYHLATDAQGVTYDMPALTDALTRQIEAAPGTAPIEIFIHAPGKLLYQYVFNASYTAWQIHDAHPGRDLNVHLVYEEDK